MAETQPQSTTTMTKYIYKITPGTPPLSLVPPEPARLAPSYSLASSSLDIASGFLHMSTAAQVPGTLRHFFSTNPSLRNTVYLLRVDYGLLEQSTSVDVRWESPDGSVCGPREGEGMFPHIYLKSLSTSGGGKDEERLARLGGGGKHEGRPAVVEVESVVEVISQIGEDGWEQGLKKMEEWLV